MPKRVIANKGKIPVIVVAPHGHPEDDLNTDVITDCIAGELRCYSVINMGWRRAPRAVLGEGIANLNNIDHCMLDPVRIEFTDPLVEFKKECISKYGRCSIFYIHGMSNEVRKKAKDRVDLVLGFGQGEPSSYTCDLMFKNAFVTRCREENFNVYQAKVGGKFAAWKEENLTQFFRKRQLDGRVNGIQIEIANSLRSEIQEAVHTGLCLTRAIDKLVRANTAFFKDLQIKEV